MSRIGKVWLISSLLWNYGKTVARFSNRYLQVGCHERCAVPDSAGDEGQPQESAVDPGVSYALNVVRTIQRKFSEDLKMDLEQFNEVAHRFVSQCMQHRDEMMNELLLTSSTTGNLGCSRISVATGNLTALETKRFKRRMVRISHHLQAQRTDAFTQPRSRSSDKLQSLRSRNESFARRLTHIEKLWRKRVNKLSAHYFFVKNGAVTDDTAKANLAKSPAVSTCSFPRNAVEE